MRVKSNYKSFAKGVEAEKKVIRNFVSSKIIATARFVHQSLIDKTPVWEGKTVRNYIMTIGSPFSGEYDEINNGPTGKTSSMPLGSEPRRGPNAAAALKTGSVLNEKTALSKIFITNNTDSVQGLEFGDLPGGGKPSRSPGGMYGLTLTEVQVRLRSKRL